MTIFGIHITFQPGCCPSLCSVPKQVYSDGSSASIAALTARHLESSVSSHLFLLGGNFWGIVFTHDSIRKRRRSVAFTGWRLRHGRLGRFCLMGHGVLCEIILFGIRGFNPRGSQWSGVSGNRKPNASASTCFNPTFMTAYEACFYCGGTSFDYL